MDPRDLVGSNAKGLALDTGKEGEEAVMKACVGDRLVVDAGDPARDRVGLVIGVQHEDGTPPYVIKWLSDGHVALVFPGPYARILPASEPEGAGGPQPDSTKRAKDLG
jgi:Domain of unknown function (DUF1918)